MEVTSTQLKNTELISDMNIQLSLLTDKIVNDNSSMTFAFFPLSILEAVPWENLRYITLLMLGMHISHLDDVGYKQLTSGKVRLKRVHL